MTHLNLSISIIFFYRNSDSNLPRAKRVYKLFSSRIMICINFIGEAYKDSRLERQSQWSIGRSSLARCGWQTRVSLLLLALVHKVAWVTYGATGIRKRDTSRANVYIRPVWARYALSQSLQGRRCRAEKIRRAVCRDQCVTTRTAERTRS